MLIDQVQQIDTRENQIGELEEIKSIGHMTERGPCFIIPLSTIIDCWNVSFVFSIVDSIICNPNIYSRGIKRSNRKLAPLSLSLCCSRALLLFLSNWVFLFVFFIKSLYKTSLKRTSHFEKNLGICLTRSLTTHYVSSE